MALTKPIPEALRNEMENDSFYRFCCILDGQCSGRIEWHHNLRSYVNGNKGRVNEKFCILPVCKYHHSKADNREVKEKLDWVMWNRASNEQIKFYSVAVDYKFEKERLNKIYGN